MGNFTLALVEVVRRSTRSGTGILDRKLIGYADSSQRRNFIDASSIEESNVQPAWICPVVSLPVQHTHYSSSLSRLSWGARPVREMRGRYLSLALALGPFSVLGQTSVGTCDDLPVFIDEDLEIELTSTEVRKECSIFHPRICLACAVSRPSRVTISDSSLSPSSDGRNFSRVSKVGVSFYKWSNVAVEPFDGPTYNSRLKSSRHNIATTHHVSGMYA